MCMVIEGNSLYEVGGNGNHRIYSLESWTFFPISDFRFLFILFHLSFVVVYCPSQLCMVRRSRW